MHLFARQRPAGVDEAGRGPLAGPVVAAAVILDPRRPIDGLADSKKLPEQRRDELAEIIRKQALAYSVAWADAAEIDAINILQATFLAMRRAVLGLAVQPDYLEVDGNKLPRVFVNGSVLPGEAIVGGDDKVDAISAASILAKVCRDDMMRLVDRQYPDYGFARHKGYGTAAHLEALAATGPCPQHRLSFRPCRPAVRQLPQNSDQ